MSKNDDKRITGLPEQEPEIFGRSKSREEIKAELKAAKKAKRAELKASLRAQRLAKKAQPKEKQPELWITFGVLGMVMVLILVALGFGFANDTKMKGFEQDADRETYFVDSEAVPELTDEGLSAAVTAAYYTKSGYLCVELNMGNGTAKPLYMYELEVQIFNGNEELVASGYTEDIDPTYVVASGGTAPYTFYISPEHVKIADDPLTNISYSVTASGYEAEDKN